MKNNNHDDFWLTLGIILVGLKLGLGNSFVMDWSWWLVTSPFWGRFLFVTSDFLSDITSLIIKTLLKK